MNSVNTLILCDGGRRDKYGFDAAYIELDGIPIIGFCIRAAINSKYIQRIYIYSDLVEKAHQTAQRLLQDNPRIKILRADDPMPDLTAEEKVIRIVPAEEKLVMSISKTFFIWVVNDTPGLGKFSGDWKSAADIEAYKKQYPQVKDFPLVFMGNDQPLCRAEDLDDLIENFDPDLHDSLISYTRQSVLRDYLNQANLSIEDFHYTLRKNDFINGDWMRHNCLYVLKWGKMDRRLTEVVSFYNQHRVQSKLINFILVIRKAAAAYRGKKPEVIRLLLLSFLFAVGKYFKNFRCRPIRNLVAHYLNNQKVLKFTGRLSGYRIFVFDRGSARPVIDVDARKDVLAAKKLLQYEGRLGMPGEITSAAQIELNSE